LKSRAELVPRLRRGARASRLPSVVAIVGGAAVIAAVQRRTLTIDTVKWA
jgi:hypothetical protein